MMYTFTEKEHVITQYFSSLEPLIMRQFPSKQKRIYIALTMIIDCFDKHKKYHEKDVNAVLRSIYDDHVTIRRYLIEYRLLARTKDGALYWCI